MTKDLSKIRSEGFRPLVYISTQNSGEEKVENARAFSRFAVDKNAVPFAPLLIFPQFMKEGEKELTAFMKTIFIRKCQEIWVMDGFVSEEMREEVMLAERYRKIIRYFALQYDPVKAIDTFVEIDSKEGQRR